jgi:hypothetical protein
MRRRIGALYWDTARCLERVPELLGIGPHLLATAVGSESGQPSQGRGFVGARSDNELLKNG